MTSQIIITGNLTSDPELRFTQSGDAVANLTVAVNERKKSGDQWEDDGATFYRVAAWRDLAENVAESLQRGMRVIVSGGLRTRTWTDKEGTERLSLDLTADEIGPSLRWATARVTRTQSSGGQRPQQQRPQQRSDDPWAAPDRDDQPPF